MATRHIGWAALVLLSACGKAGEPAAPAATEVKVSEERWKEVFPAYPGARHLCAQHVSGTNMHIEWSAYATSAAPGAVIAFYEQHKGSLTVDRSSGGFSLRGPSDKVLSVHAKDDTYPRCDVPPAAGDATVIIVSQAIR